MTAATTSIDPTTGGVKIQWTAPNSNSEPITKYLIEVKKADGTYLEDTTNCNGANSVILANLYCIIPMSVLKGSSYNLVYPQLVEVRASAYN
jgi:hypothetical protein